MSADAGGGYGAIAGGVTSAFETLASGVGLYLQSDYSKKAASKAYNRSVEAYKHRYQWAVEDMIKAGINPMMAAGGVSGNVSAPMASTPDFGGVGKGVGSAVGKYFDIKARQQEIRNMEIMGRKLDAEQVMIDQQTMKAHTENEILRKYGYSAAEQQLKGSEIENTLNSLRVPAMEREAEIDESAFGKYMRWLNRGISSAIGLNRATK
ncbi:MAG: DNA pilot protein [Microviridae sp.]|nr:MAG: DNA pilot protein [Microviridae sp.]